MVFRKVSRWNLTFRRWCGRCVDVAAEAEEVSHPPPQLLRGPLPPNSDHNTATNPAHVGSLALGKETQKINPASLQHLTRPRSSKPSSPLSCSHYLNPPLPGFLLRFSISSSESPPETKIPAELWLLLVFLLWISGEKLWWKMGDKHFLTWRKFDKRNFQRSQFVFKNGIRGCSKRDPTDNLKSFRDRHRSGSLYVLHSYRCFFHPIRLEPHNRARWRVHHLDFCVIMFINVSTRNVNLYNRSLHTSRQYISTHSNRD